MPDVIPNGNFSPYLAQIFTPPGLGWQQIPQLAQQAFGQPYLQQPYFQQPYLQQPYLQQQAYPFGVPYQQGWGGAAAGRFVPPPVYIDVVQAADMLARILPLAVHLHQQTVAQQLHQQWQQPGWQQTLTPQLGWQQQLPQQAMVGLPFGQQGPFTGQGDAIGRMLPFLTQQGIAGNALAGMGYRI
jgi:hypothetical protein